MLGLQADGRYADLMELELYNAALAGMQLDGKRFFYVNPLAVDPAVAGRVPGYMHVLPQRPQWHACACCPPNLARLIGSLGKYLWSEDENAVYSHLFISSRAETALGTFRLETGCPWQGGAAYTVETCRPEPFALWIHIPSYIRDVRICVNGTETELKLKNGYACIERVWKPGDRVEAVFDLPVRRVYAHPRVRDAAGKTALARGPVLYCLEEKDNGRGLTGLALPRAAQLEAVACTGELGDIVALEADGLRQKAEALYSDQSPAYDACRLRAVPYYAWGNRGAGEMTVWIREI